MKDFEIELIACAEVLGRVERLLASRVSISEVEEFWPYICFDNKVFLETLCEIRTSLFKDKVDTPKFLEVGCGIGTKVLLAQKCGFDSYGLEIRKEYVDIASELIGSYAFDRVFLGDGAEYKDYKVFDVIYFYLPCCDNDLEQKLERFIIGEVKKDTIIYAVGHTDEFGKAVDRNILEPIQLGYVPVFVRK